MSQGCPSHRTAVCTIISKNYLHYARTLMKSVQAVHPEWIRYVLLVDEVDGHFDPEQEQFRLIEVTDLPLPDKKKFLFRYTILELNTAVKPWFLEWLFESERADRVIFLDPDIFVYQPLNEVERALDSGAFMVLTPHLTAALDEGARPTDHDILKAGCYNLGFIALRRHAELEHFLCWWKGKLEFDCRLDLSNNLFVDQRWMDLAPGLFSDVSILRHDGYNVAYWNLNHRSIQVREGQFLANDKPLAFFHFSGLNPKSPDNLSRYQNRFRLSELDIVRGLVQDYCKAVQRNGLETSENWRYAFGYLQSGDQIPDRMRQFYRSNPMAQQEAGDDPFGHDHDYLNQTWGTHWCPMITRLMRCIWESRPDLQKAFPEMSGDDRRGYAAWYVANIASQEHVPERFIAPVRRSIAEFESSFAWLRPEGAPIPKTYILPKDDLPWRFARHSGNLLVFAMPLRGRFALARTVYFLSRLIAKLLLVCVLQVVQRSRNWLMLLRSPDLWLVLRQLLSMRLQNLALAFRKILPSRNRQTPGRSPRVHSVGDAARPDMAPFHRGVHEPPCEGTCSRADVAQGINIIGYVRSEHGVGESARLCAKAATAVGLRFSMLDVSLGNQSRAADDTWLHRLAQHNSYWFNLFHINADQMLAAHATLGRQLFEAHYNIGFWHWELPEFPDHWLRAFDFVDEVWVPSRFVMESIRSKARIPVVRIPHCIRFRVDSDVTRLDMGLPAGHFLFLTMIDLLSVPARKNPQGAVEAFRKAFPNPNNVSLVIKINNGTSCPNEANELKAIVANDPRIILIDRTLSRQQVYNLQGLCDCFVSLHRSEGFGLGLAESMFLRKPVIATNWSGNRDFMNFENSCPVHYQLVALERDYGPYSRGQVWAEPNLDHAAWYMAKIIEGARWRKSIARRGQQTVRNEFSPERVGQMYQRRLQSLLQQAREEKHPQHAAA